MNLIRETIAQVWIAPILALCALVLLQLSNYLLSRIPGILEEPHDFIDSEPLNPRLRSMIRHHGYRGLIKQFRRKNRIYWNSSKLTWVSKSLNTVWRGKWLLLVMALAVVMPIAIMIAMDRAVGMFTSMQTVDFGPSEIFFGLVVGVIWGPLLTILHLRYVAQSTRNGSYWILPRLTVLTGQISSREQEAVAQRIFCLFLFVADGITVYMMVTIVYSAYEIGFWKFTIAIALVTFLLCLVIHVSGRRNILTVSLIGVLQMTDPPKFLNRTANPSRGYGIYRMELESYEIATLTKFIERAGLKYDSMRPAGITHPSGTVLLAIAREFRTYLQGTSSLKSDLPEGILELAKFSAIVLSNTSLTVAHEKVAERTNCFDLDGSPALELRSGKHIGNSGKLNGFVMRIEQGNQLLGGMRTIVATVTSVIIVLLGFVGLDSYFS